MHTLRQTHPKQLFWWFHENDEIKVKVNVTNDLDTPKTHTSKYVEISKEVSL